MRESTNLAQKEFALFRTEVSENLKTMVMGVAMLVVAAVFAIAAILLFTEALVEWLATVVGSEALAALIVGGVLLAHRRRARTLGPERHLGGLARADAQPALAPARQPDPVREGFRMSQNIRDLEQDIEQSRARLDLTIDRLQGKIQDKLTVSGMVDDLLGRGRQSRYAAVYDHTLAVIKRNPIPVMLIAAGVGWLIHRMSTEGERSDAALRVRSSPGPRRHGAASRRSGSPHLRPRHGAAPARRGDAGRQVRSRTRRTASLTFSTRGERQ